MLLSQAHSNTNQRVRPREKNRLLHLVMRGTGALESLIPVVVVPAGLIPVPNTEEGVVPVGVVVVGVVVDGVVVLGVVPVGVVVGVVPVGVVVGVVPVGVVGVVPVWLNKAKHHHININLKTMLHYEKKG